MPSISEIARGIQTDVREVAAKVPHQNRKYRHTREKAALIVSDIIGVPFASETLRKTSCAYVNIQGYAMYADDDLITLSTDILSNARKCGRTPKPRNPQGATT